MAGGNFFDFRDSLLGPRRRPKGVVAPPAGNGAAGAGGPNALTVTELTGKIDVALRDCLPAHVLVRGQVSNFRGRSPSGHWYFTLKDDANCLDCVTYRSDAARVRFEPHDGLEVIAGGQVKVYGPKGKYQLVAESLEPVGQGALELAFQQMRAKLEREGLFAADRKRPLPKYPKRIVLVTSTQTAALQDILKVLRRYPFLRLAVYHVPVQGDGAGERIAAALRHINATVAARGTAHAVVLARGGGSLEDLWAFNEEPVARAVAESILPVVTGIGHEVDVSIADLVADHHAHTPTEAAQVLVRHWRTAGDELAAAAHRLDRGAWLAVGDARQRLKAIARHEAFRRPLDGVHARRQRVDEVERELLFAAERRVTARRRRLDDVAARLETVHPAKLVARGCGQTDALEARLVRAVSGRLKLSRDRLARADVRLAERSPRHLGQLVRQRLDQLSARFLRGTVEDLRRRRLQLARVGDTLEALSPEAVLRRGYSITSRAKDGRVVKSAGDVRTGDKLVTRFADGEVRSTAEDARQMSLFE